jgi:HPt (histidine-containing phosphotransfer) domain-containing protein
MNTVYLNLPVATQRIGDADLVNEMLVMLQASLPKDWQDFLSLMTEHKFIEAEKILHQMKGTIPFFTDEITSQLLHTLDALLKNATDTAQIQEQQRLLQTRMNGFQAELDAWYRSVYPS